MKNADENIIIRPATRADVEAFREVYKDRPGYDSDRFFLNTIQAWCIEKDNKLACIAGVVFGKGYYEAFSDVMPDLVAPKRMIFKYAKVLADIIRGLNLPVIAVATEEPDSSRFLMSMGFRYVPESVKANKKIFRI